MSGRTTSSLGAGLLWLVAVAIALVTGVVAGLDVEAWVFSLATLAMPTVGALIAWRHPRNPIGWLYCGFGICWALLNVSESLPTPVSPTLIELWITWIGSFVWIPALIGTFTFPFLLFPDGRLLSRRWQVIVWIAGAVIAVLCIQAAFAEEFLPFSELRNPAYVEAITGVMSPIEASLALAAVIVVPLLVVAPALSIVLRFRRSTGAARQQIKWFAYVVGLWFACSVITFVVSQIGAAAFGVSTDWAGDLLFALFPLIVIIGLPVAIGIAMLRHRLYDIDVLIRRTLVYGLLTLSLGLVYVLLVLLPAILVGSGGSAPQVVIAASTLVVAALTRPLRARIQRTVDRRFFRRKYNATRTLEAFSGHVRDEVDLVTLAAALCATVQETMQPAHVSIWLRSAERGRE
ncbi:MAG TPA: hypothetical protein VMM78_06460 [Thermomicrobiales bacterium]|nr:hypothetical protein [Thermomicrobiales bacterium]